MMNETYKSMQGHIRPDEALIERTLIAANAKPKRKPILKYTGIAAAAACLAMIGSVPVLAQNVPAFYHALYKIAPETAERFKPLEMISESNGIRMEVGAIYFHENTVEAYITMQDLEGDRLGDWESFCSVSSLIVPRIIEEEHGTIWQHRLDYAGFDETSGDLTLLLSIENVSDNLHAGDEAIYNLSRVLGNGVKWSGSLDMLDLTSVIQDAEFCENGELAIVGGNRMPEWESEDVEEMMLKPFMEMALPAKSVTFTGAGYHDGLLHVQMYYEDLDLNNNGDIFLQKADGTKIHSIAEFQGCTDRNQINDLESVYKDYVFDISVEELAEYTLYGDFTKFTTLVEGGWEVTFTLPERSE